MTDATTPPPPHSGHQHRSPAPDMTVPRAAGEAHRLLEAEAERRGIPIDDLARIGRKIGLNPHPEAAS